MAKAHRFKSADGASRTIDAFTLSAPIRIEADGTYETDDEREIEVLKASGDVAEVKGSKKSDDQKD